MNCKTTFMLFAAVVKNCRMLLLAMLFSFILLQTGHLQAQTLVTDSAVPVLDVCSDYQQFTVKIGRGSTACPNGKLKIELPTGFELESGSVKVGGVPATVSGQTTQEVTVDVNIPSGPASQEIEVTYNAKALCSAISSTITDPSVSYTLQGCTGVIVPKSSETINIRYAVLRIDVTPNPIIGNINDVVERTISIRNQGNGELPVFTFERILGGGLSQVSYDYSSLTSLGWVVTVSGNQLIFSGANANLKFKSGETLSFKEKVQIVSCALTPTDYEVFYGCSTKCTDAAVNSTATHIINLNTPNAPQLSVTAAQPVINCFNGLGQNSWTVTNTGSAATGVIEFEIGTQDLLGYISTSGITVNGNPAVFTVTPGTNPKTVKIQLPAIAGGANAVVSFFQYYGAPTGTPASCLSAPEQFGTGQNYFNASYTYTGACAPITTGRVVSSEVSYSYGGMHIGEVDIVAGQAYTADYLFMNTVIPSTQLKIGDKFVITVELAADLNTAGFSFNGVTAVNIAGTKKYTVTFTYGSAPWVSGSLNLSFLRMQFPLSFSCPANLDNLWYRVGGEIIKVNNGVDCTSVVFRCNQTDLKGYCDGGPCPDGMQNGPAGIKRLTVGHAVSVSGVPAVGTPSVAGDFRTFYKGDILEVYQDATIVNTTANSFNTVRFVVEKDPSVNAVLVTGSGKVVRNGVNLTSNATVTETATSYVMQFVLPAGSFLNNDNIRMSIQIKAGNSGTGLKQFPAKSYLVDGTGEGILCGRTYTATGFYVTTNYSFRGASANFVNCSNNTNTVIFTAGILGFNNQDAIFQQEYRRIFAPTNAVFQVPAYITLTNIRVTVANQPWMGSNNFVDVPVTNVTNGNYTLNLTQALTDITEKTLGVGNGIAYLDEGFELRLTPTVSVSACEPVNTGAVQNVQVVMNGNIVDGAGLTTPYSNSQNLTYNTGIGSLTLQTSNNSLLGTLSPDGTQVSWVVRVGASGTRDFNSVWFAKKIGVLAISSVELVSGYGAVSGSAVTPVGNIYQLGDFSANSAKFYLIKASVVGCTVNSLTLTAGYNCVSNAYPATINSSVCTLPDKVLTHKTIANVLQTELFDQFNGNSTVKPDLCGRIWYTVRLHNGGDTQLGNLKIKIPLNTAPGLVFDDSFEYSAVFNANGGTASGFTTINGSNTAINGSNELEITLPNTVLLNSAQRVSVRIYFRVNSCDFKSGSKHTATPSATNSCGTAVTNITPATTRRLIIAGGSDSFPELREVGTSSVVLDPVLTTGGVLRSVYNAEIVNSGQFNVNDAVTSDYNVALKLPAGWSIVGNPATYLLPAGKVDYIGLDPNRGYVYKIKTGQTIAVSQSLKFENVPLKYTLNNQTALQCDHNFGDITISVYQNIAVAACTPIPNCSNTGIDQVLFENTTIMQLPVDSALAIVPANQSPVICNPTVSGGVPTVADIPFAATTNVFHIDWYENLQEATSDLPANRIPLNTPLVNGRTYYAVNRFIVDGTCKSNIGTITVTLKANSLSGSVTTLCAVNNQTYQVRVTLNGTAPYAVTGTGAPGTFAGNVWTSAPLTAATPFGSGTPYNVTFTDANNCTPLNVTGVAPMCCELVITCPATVTVDCGESLLPARTGQPTIVRSCGNTTYTYVDTTISTCSNDGLGNYTRSFTRTFTVTDEQGNKKTCTQVINIRDNASPVFNGALPQSITVSCASAVPPVAQMSATDNCGTATVTFNEARQNGSCSNRYTLTRVWTATDGCGRTTTHTQVITVNDNIAPVFIGTLPANITVSCDNVPVAATLTATDNCGTPTVVMNQTRTDVSCPNNYTLTRVWTATDVCGNTSSHTQIIKVTDTVKPTFNGTLPADITISCSAALPTIPTVTATDNCGSATVVFNETTVAGNCMSSYVRTRTWTATDACGNTASHVQKITVADTEKPVFTGTLPANVTVSCPSEIPATAVLAATDNCTASGSISITVNDVVSDVSPSCANNYKVTRTYTATDACGNFTTHVQLITVEDKTKPLFVEALPVNATYSCSSEVPSAVTLTATDNCGTATVTFNETRVSGSCANAYVLTRTWTAADSCGNTTVHTQTITVDDKTKPVFTTAPGDQEVECDGAGNVSAFNAWLASYAGAVATDNCGPVALSYQIEDTNTTCGGSKTIIVNFIATDSCGNTSAEQAEFKITDKVAPVVTSASNLSLVCGNDVNAQITNWLQNHGGATATDACGTITWSHNYNGLTGACANTGSALVTFTATDSCGNASTVQATVTVTDTVAPTFVGSLPAAAVTVSCASEIPAPAVLTATDNCGTATVTLVETTTAGTCANNFTLTRVWTATDVCGNTTSHTQIITVNDQTAPAITTNAQSITVQCDGSGNTTALNAWLASHGGSVSTDNCGGVTWTNNYAAANFVASCGSAGSVEVIFTATDACGNASSTTAVFTIEDTAKPVFTGTLPANVTVSCPSEIPATAVLAATDNCTASGSISITVNDVVSDVSPSCANNYKVTRTYTATDACGNFTTHVQLITVEDKTKPVFVEALPVNVTYSCSSEVPSAVTLTATDNCGTATVTFNETRVSGSCANAYVLTRTWTAADSCGNTTVHTQTITVDDKTKPVFTVEPQNKIVECDGLGNLDGPEGFNAWLASNAGAIATDNCGAVTISYLIEDTNTICGGAGTIIVDFIAKDQCGNFTVKQAVYMILDRTPPVVTPAADLVIQCSINGEDELNAWLSNNGGATATDSCGLITWKHNYQSSLAICGAPILVTFTATDSCGNASTTQASVSVVDTVVPVLTKQAQGLTVQCGTNTTQALNNWLANHAGAEASDSCSTVTWTNNYNAANFVAACGATGSVEVIFTGSDSCGNVVTTTATFTIEDTTAPTLVKAAQPKTVECDGSGNTTELQAWLANHGGATATDTCAGSLTWTNDYNAANFTALCGGTGSVTVTFTAADACGNSVSTVSTFTIVDTTKPVFNTEPQNEVVECDGSGNTSAYNAWLANHGGGIATDNCGAVTYTYSVVDTAVLCGKTSKTTVKFTATDSCGNKVNKQAVFTIEDTTAPVITVPSAALTIQCGNDVSGQITTWLNNHGGATATEGCGTVSWTHNYNGLTAACGTTGSALVTFTATDSCGNASTTQASVSVIDTVVPVLTKQAQGLTVQCGTNTTQALNNWLANHAGAEASDSCSTVTWTNNYNAANFVAACGATGSVEVIFTGNDSCGNVVTTTATFTIEDTTAPTLVKAAQPKTVECDGSGNTTELQAWLANHGGATATDTCAGSLTWTNDYNAANFTALCGGTGSVTVTFTASDACGNSVSTIATFTITDTTKPVFTTEPQNEVVECDGSGNTSAYNAWLANHGGGIATDNCGAVTYTYSVVDTAVLCGKTSKTTVKFTATDSCGNKVNKQVVFTIQDTTAPVITVPSAALTIQCGNDVSGQITTWLNNRGGATATEGCGTVSWTHNYNGLTAACGTTGSALVTFTATDSCGNASTTQATVSVIDTIVPVLTKQAQGLTVQCGTNTTQALNNWLANHAGAEASDSCSTVTWTNNYNAANFVAACGATGSVEVIFTGSDSCGNVVTTTATFTIEDTTAPTLVKAAQPKTVECDGSGNLTELNTWLANHGGATATDTCAGSLTWINDYNAANFTALCGGTGSVTVTFTAADACGNSVSTVSTFTIADTTKPVFTTEPQNEVVECDGSGNTSAYNAWLASYGNSTATDNCGAVAYTYSVVDTAVLCGKTSKTTVQFTATDACGNAINKQAVFTIQDTQSPEFVKEADNLIVECDGTGNNSDLTAWLSSRAGATAKDSCSGELTWTNDFTGLTKDCGSTGSTTVTFTVTDACGNSNTTTASFTIVDTTAPVFSTNLPLDRTIECSDDIPEVAVVIADDLCSKATVSFTEKRIDGNCPNNYELERTWTASDACGNTAKHVQIITVQDTTAPEFTGTLPEAEIFIKCEDLKDAESLKAIDNCGQATVTVSDDVIKGACDTKYDILRTWKATDDCGNETSFTQTIHLSCAIEVFNAVTPNGDGYNDELLLNGIECYPGNTVAIYNRWGVLVYETKNYNSRGNTFKGFSEGRVTVNKDPKLPTGTYYYLIKYNYDLGNGQIYPIEQTGYLHLETTK